MALPTLGGAVSHPEAVATLLLLLARQNTLPAMPPQLPGAGGGAAPPSHQRRTTALLVALAAVLERCDEQMLPALYRYVGASWSATPTQLGLVTLARACTQALCSPLGGIAGHCFHRGAVVALGCVLFAAASGAFAACHTLSAGAVVWSINGLGLAFVLPNVQVRRELA